MKTIIFGSSRQGKIIREILSNKRSFAVDGFLDDDVSKHGIVIDGLPVIGGLDWAITNASEGLAAIVAIGNNDARITIGRKLRELGVGMINAVHPSAVVMAGTTIGTGNLICAGAVVVTGTYIEDDVVVNTGATIDHDCILHNGAYVSPGVHTAGCVTIGCSAFIGLGAVLGPNVTIGDRCIVGAGSVVLSDLPPNVLAFGVPAKVMRPLGNSVDWSKILAG